MEKMWGLTMDVWGGLGGGARMGKIGKIIKA